MVLEAFASGVPAVVMDRGGPQPYTVRHSRTGFIARDFNEFVTFTATLLDHPDLHSAMRVTARQQALITSWDSIFEGMYEVYERCLCPGPVAEPG